MVNNSSTKRSSPTLLNAYCASGLDKHTLSGEAESRVKQSPNSGNLGWWQHKWIECGSLIILAKIIPKSPLALCAPLQLFRGPGCPQVELAVLLPQPRLIILPCQPEMALELLSRRRLQ